MTKHIAVLSTGGTIANTPDGRLSVEEVLSDIAQRHPDEHSSQVADLEVIEVFRRGAETFTPPDWLTIARAAQEVAARDDIDGIVVTHGTFTAEVTAYFLHLTLNTEKPVVVACSQRKHGTVGNDGDRNFLDAVRIASSEEASGLGVVLTLNEEIHCAREVTKTSRRPSGFHSDHSGLLGTVSDDRIAFYRRPTRRHTTRSEFCDLPESLPRVDIVATYAGADGVAVDAFLRAATRGIVVNGFSYSGKPHEMQLASLQQAVATGVPVVFVNRGGDGRMPVPQEEDGFIRGDNLTAQKARVLLSLSLAASASPGDLRRIFGEY